MLRIIAIVCLCAACDDEGVVREADGGPRGGAGGGGIADAATRDGATGGADAAAGAGGDAAADAGVERDAAVEMGNGRSILGRAVVEEICCSEAAGSRAVHRDDRGLAGNMLTQMPGDRTAIGVIGIRYRETDDEIDRVLAIEFLDTLGTDRLRCSECEDRNR